MLNVGRNMSQGQEQARTCIAQFATGNHMDHVDSANRASISAQETDVLASAITVGRCK